VFGVLESLGALGVAAGALLAPLTIALVGVRGAMVAVGCITPVVCLLWWRRLRSIDRSVAVRTDAIALLRRVPMLRPLPVPVLEQLAGELTRVTVKAGDVVFEAGDRGEEFYVIASGTVDVVGAERVIRGLGAGDGFGEIALLGNGRRTMTVRAVEDAELCAISSASFLPAVSCISGARAAAEATRWSYLNHAPGSSAGELEAS
jgi:hypothetical protein